MTADGWVNVDAPEWLWGGRAKTFFESADMQYKLGPKASRSVAVCTRESYMRRKPDLVQLISAAGPGATKRGFDPLVEMSDDEIDPDLRAEVGEHLERLRAEDSSIVGAVSTYQIHAGTVPIADLPGVAQQILSEIREFTMESSDEVALPNAGVYAFRRTDSLLARVKFMSVLLRAQHDPRLAEGDLTEIKSGQKSGRPTFASSEHLTNGMYLLDAHVGVLLGALTPGVWGFAVHRGRGPLVFSFGRPLAGTTSTAANLLQTLPTQGSDRVTDFDDLSDGAAPQAVAWWADALNALFGVVTDWAVFADAEQHYRPEAHLQAIATLDQLFRRVLSIQATHTDLNARRVLLFTVLDTLEALTGHSMPLLCSLDFATTTLQHLEESIPAEAGEVLLPRARRAVEALEEVQDGFFMRAPDGSISIAPSRGEVVSPERGAALYLQMLRNATHGHGAKSKAQVEPRNTLLATHTGYVPHDLALLGWLYLLNLMARPETLRELLTKRSRRS